MRILELKKHIGYSYPNYRLRKSFCLLEGIEEECHIFDGQYRLANEIADEVLQHVMMKNSKFVIDVNYGPFSSVDVTVELIDGEDCRGNIYRINDEKNKIWIKIFIGKFSFKGKNYQQIKNKLLIPIVHELMHGNIFLNRMKSNNVADDKVDETPNYYENLIHAMNDIEPGSDSYIFSRALYLSYYQETQAMISQVWAEMRNLFSEKAQILTKNDFKYALLHIDLYKDVSDSIWICRRMLDEYYTRVKVFEELQTYGIEFDEKRNHSIIKRILNRLIKMKKKLINTAYFYFKKEYGGDTNA